MSNNIEIDKSFLSSSLYEFCDETLSPKRKIQGLSQTKISNKLGLNQSEVSRIERGLVRPKDIPTIEAICDIYKLSPAEKKRYFELTAGVNQVTNNDSSLSLLSDQINFIARLNRSGYPNAAIMHCEDLQKWLERNSMLSHDSSTSIIKETLRLLLEESAAWWDIVVPDELDSKTQPLLDKMTELANITKLDYPDNGTIYIDINKGFHAYVKQNYALAYTYFSKVLDSCEIVDNPWHVEVLRAIMIASGNLRNIGSVELHTREIERYMDQSNSLMNKGYLLEGMGRAYSRLDYKKSLFYYNKSWNYTEEASKDSNFLAIRKIQLTRSYLGLLKDINVKATALKRIAEPALNEADKAGFVRHKKQIMSIIKS